MVKGSCLCQKVKYEYNDTIDEVAICHCFQCKRAQGTVFATNSPVNASQFSITQGADLMKEYFSSPNKKRVFCGNCGSPIYSQHTELPEIIRLRLGTVTEGHIPEPNYEIFCESESKWLSENTNRPKYKQYKT
ncbi:MAG: GFA family protein [Proteobacteria bacterium]|nr:GFA family protein [Pseudomonadota bacterium]